MFSNAPKPPGRSELAVVLFYLAVAVAATVAAVAEGPPRLVALAVLVILGLYFVFGDLFLALSDERAAEKYPHGSRNSDLGRTVRVTDDFVLQSGSGRGKVQLGGEIWKARSVNGALYTKGTELVVLRVDGLVLVVGLPDESKTGDSSADM